MKVLKFGGSSVGSADVIYNVKRIVEAEREPVIVVVSAVGGITDRLIGVSRLAAQGAEYKTAYNEITDIHKTLIYQTVAADKADLVFEKTAVMLEELCKILQGISLIRDLSLKTSDMIVSYGERISSFFLSYVLEAQLFDASKFIKTNREFKRHIVDFELTNKLIRETFADMPQVSIVPGFISSDAVSGDITNLGRGGSDYTASIIAAELGANVLEIWTDVDGFMTADPKVINNAYVIEKLSYLEALELCNFGAKVIYPPTIYPVFHKKIPVRIKNTFKPELKGTYISQEHETAKDKSLIKGISSISDTCLITVQGHGMVGVIGVDSRIFNALAGNGISVFLVSQASSENSITLGVKNADAELAVSLLKKAFEKEIAQREIDQIFAQSDLATVAIVGENMKDTPGIDSRLFNSLGRNSINVIAIAQGAPQMHVSVVINKENLKKALNAIHDAFFLSEYQVINIFLAGVGTVGGNLLKQIKNQIAPLRANNSLEIKIIGLANSKHFVCNKEGINIENYRDILAADPSEIEAKGGNVLPSTPQIIKESIINMNLFNSIFVDCTANDEIPSIYGDLLKHSISVVTANKIAASSSYETYAELKQCARKSGVKFLFETNVGAGLPIINTINALINSGDRIIRLEAVLSGTLNFIFNVLSDEISLSKAVMMAKESGYSEPDPRIDLSGKDVIRKLLILSREAGYRVEQSDVKANLFIPDNCFEGSQDDFWSELKKLDKDFELKRKALAEQGKKLRFVATLHNTGTAVETSVGLQEVDSRHPFFELEGSNNIILITTDRYKEYPMVIKGYGAGADVTAAGVFADIISVVNIR
ncbi:MAG: bifunctional aspartate kinase/homoserine dehydrogenase I [Prevotellaceae bacterium]|jgi:aspartokinase/homoserine dehydrogenase 1|nr:bifunctional aspartate kinase/homoserine dehydrogenase I [Prevotellaceae bacterium]